MKRMLWLSVLMAGMIGSTVQGRFRQPPPEQLPPPQPLINEVILIDFWLTLTDVKFEIEYPGSSNEGSFQRIYAMAKYKAIYDDTTLPPKIWEENVGLKCDWYTSDENVYPLLKWDNLFDDLFIHNLYNDAWPGTTIITVASPCGTKCASCTVEAVDSRPGRDPNKKK